MAQINLAPNSQYMLATRRRRRVLYSLTAILVVAAVVVGFVLSVLVSSVDTKVETVRAELSSIETEIASASDKVKRINLFENRLKNVETLLANHRVWTTYLQEIERLLPPDTQLQSFVGKYADRTISVGGTAQNLDAVAVTLATLQNKAPEHTTLFKSGTISSVIQEAQTGPAGEVLGQRYSFQMALTF